MTTRNIDLTASFVLRATWWQRRSTHRPLFGGAASHVLAVLWPLQQVESSDTILLNLKHEKLEVGALRVVAIDAGGGLVPLNQEKGGVVIAVIVPYLAFGRHTTVDENESLRIYQSTRQIQITGSGFRNSTKVSDQVSWCFLPF